MAQGIFPVFSQETMDELYTNRFSVMESNYSDRFSGSELNHMYGKKISGILCRENEVVLTDKENGKLIVLDKEGNLIQEIGEKGNGQLEFLNPAGITLYN